MPKTPLQMLLRGQNLVGYRHYEDGVVDRFVQKAAENGMDVFRVFDALNDIRNLERAIRAVRRTGKHAQGTICYTTSPVHTIEGFVKLAEQLRELGCRFHLHQGHGGAAEAAAGLRSGARASRRRCGEEVRVHVHVHATTGVTLVSLMKAIEAGADCVDTAISSHEPRPWAQPDGVAGRDARGNAATGQPSTRRGCCRSRTTSRASGRATRSSCRTSLGWTPSIFKSQIPGGMISNMESQLKQQGAADRIKEVLAEVPQVRRDAGFPPLVTPSSQIVGTQAVFNVMMGRYKVMTAEFADLMLGYYGDTIAPRDPEVVALAQTHARKQPITCRPARPAEARVGRPAGAGHRPRRMRRNGRGRPDLRDVPAGGDEVLRAPPRRAEERRQGPGREAGGEGSTAAPAAATPDDGRGPVRSEITYDVKLGGQHAQGHRDAGVGGSRPGLSAFRRREWKRS